MFPGQTELTFVDLARKKAPPETRRILMINNIIGSDGYLPPGVESVIVENETIRLVHDQNFRRDPSWQN